MRRVLRLVIIRCEGLTALTDRLDCAQNVELTHDIRRWEALAVGLMTLTQSSILGRCSSRLERLERLSARMQQKSPEMCELASSHAAPPS